MRARRVGYNGITMSSTSRARVYLTGAALAALLLGLWFCPAALPAAAAGDPIRVISTRQESKFPSGLSFTLEAEWDQ